VRCGFCDRFMVPVVDTEEKTIWECEHCGEVVRCVKTPKKEINSVDINEKTSPGWEVVLRLHGVEICVVAAFSTSPVSADIVVGCADKTLVSAYAEMLRTAAFGVETASNWQFLNSGNAPATAGSEGTEESLPPWS